jgi:hypothetical protein
MARKPTDTVPLMLRLPENLRRRIEHSAKKQQRSLNAEIIHRLEESFTRQDQAALIEKTATAVVEEFRVVGFGPAAKDEGNKS